MNVTELEQQDKEIREAEAWKGWRGGPRAQGGKREMKRGKSCWWQSAGYCRPQPWYPRGEAWGKSLGLSGRGCAASLLEVVLPLSQPELRRSRLCSTERVRWERGVEVGRVIQTTSG